MFHLLGPAHKYLKAQSQCEDYTRPGGQGGFVYKTASWRWLPQCKMVLAPHGSWEELRVQVSPYSVTLSRSLGDWTGLVQI